VLGLRSGDIGQKIVMIGVLELMNLRRRSVGVAWRGIRTGHGAIPAARPQWARGVIIAFIAGCINGVEKAVVLAEPTPCSSRRCALFRPKKHLPCLKQKKWV